MPFIDAHAMLHDIMPNLGLHTYISLVGVVFLKNSGSWNVYSFMWKIKLQVEQGILEGWCSSYQGTEKLLIKSVLYQKCMP